MARKSNILLETGTNELEIIEFILEYPDECGKPVAQPFGINVAKVREIIRLPEFTRWPHLHDSLLGIFRLRDQLIPALDLVKWLNKHESVLDNQKMIISEINQIRIGFLVNGSGASIAFRGRKSSRRRRWKTRDWPTARLSGS